jgi:two-component system, OmpR family, KDP operon response regulator KdpE
MQSDGSGFRPKARIVLFVEDNADLRDLYSIALRDAGLFVAEVTSVMEAVEMAPRLRPDLVVLDRYLADGDGWEVARSIKGGIDTKHAQILGFTASRGRGDVENALVAGCDAFVEKGCTPEQLVRFSLGLLGLPLPEDEELVRKLG